MKGLLRGLLNSGTTSLKNHWWILIPFLSLGGIIGTQSIEMLHLEKLQEDTTQLKNLLTLEYHLSFILIGLHMITGFMIQTIHGTGYSNEPLRRSLERFAKFPIATAQEENQPRLLLVAVDVADGIPVTFDSYPKEDGLRKTEYGRFVGNNNENLEHVIHYDKGITSDHVMASGSYPVNFDFAKIDVESYNSEQSSSNRQMDLKKIGSSNGNGSSRRKEMRYFWDGGLMTNTPLMQLVVMHRNYWYKVRGLKDTVPRLGICVINLHPKKQAEIPTDRDGVINRNSDITFSDRTDREEGMLLLTSDYVDLIRALIKVAEEHGVKEDIINKLLNQKTKFHGELVKATSYRDILEGRFQIDEIIRVDRNNDEHTISNKTFDFSSQTIKLLLEQGYNDAHNLIHTLETSIRWRSRNE